MNIFLNLFDITRVDDYSITGLNSELKCINIFDLFEKNHKGILVVTSSTYGANKLYQSLSNYTDRVLFFPMDDFLTSEAIAISPEFKVERLNTLNILSENSNYIVVTNLMGALRYLPKKDLWNESKIKLYKGQDLSRDDLVQKLFNIGYERDVLVTGTGKVGVRGYVIDVFPTSFENAIRVEFWGDTIDSIKYFDVDTQLSLDEINEVVINPYTEFILDNDYDIDDNSHQKYLKYYSNEISIISDYLDNGIVCFDDYNTVCKSYSLLVDTIGQYKLENHDNIDTDYMHSIEEIQGIFKVFYYHFDDDLLNANNNFIFKVSNVKKYNGDYFTFRNDLLEFVKNGKTVILCIKNKMTVNRILNYLEIGDIVTTNVNNIIENKINIIYNDINEGFIFNNYVFISKNNLFNYKNDTVKYKSRFRIGSRISELSNLQVGDYIVHEMFGIGIYQGLVTINKQGIKKDYVKIIYAGDDILYIPVENIDRISKFTGKEGLSLKLNSLSDDKWKKKKTRVREKLESIANDLLDVSASRKISDGFMFSQDDESQIIFENEFKYEMTKDQIKATSLIKQEMEKPIPMDMLLCGDVGYGKTEVAFRAMFKAVNDGKQVVYLCPTTILSSQQYDSAIERFSNFPIEIALINRFVDNSKQLQIMEDLKKGKIDIVFGTHRLLNESFKFKDLGLLVVDEEQRFGVTHKEKIKKIKSSVDVLTLSATPIPRTLQLSLTGLRSLALIETPPKERYPIQTYVMEETNLIIKDAIYKELSRNGQVFILFNSIEKIEQKVFEISKLVPEAKIKYAHGRMDKTKLENIMNSFIHGEFNVLVCTTIIETGIDIPNVNTLIILDADRFGLSQLYQIRGRIGRSNKIGYAYLMYGKNKFLNDIAIKRLDTIKEFTELGSGFKIAMRDLSIRGAGDILGREQSGFIDSVGINLYLKMLNDAINKSKGINVNDDVVTYNDKPLINVSTHIDDEYVMDSELKIIIHKKINEVNSFDNLCKIKSELEDRFGKLNDDMVIYMYEEWFEKLAKNLQVENVIDLKNSCELVFSSSLSKKIMGDKIFDIISKISHEFTISFKNNCYHIVLKKINLEKHYLLYLIDLLVNINEVIKDII